MYPLHHESPPLTSLYSVLPGCRSTGFEYLSNPTTGHIPEASRIKKDTCSPMFIATLFTIARTWKQPRCPLADERIRKLWYIYTIEYYSSIKRNAFESVLTTNLFLYKSNESLELSS